MKRLTSAAYALALALAATALSVLSLLLRPARYSLAIGNIPIVRQRVSRHEKRALRDRVDPRRLFANEYTRRVFGN